MKVNISKGWTPDYSPLAMPDGGLVVCKNVVPLDEYYAPMPDKLQLISTVLDGTPLAARCFRSNNGNAYSLIGTTSKIYRVEINDTVTDVSIAGGYTAGTNAWNFAQYGEWIVATDYANDIQVLKAFSSGAACAALGGTPPKCKYVLIHSGYLILAYLNDGTVYPKKLQWSAHESIEDFTASLTTGSDSQDLADADGEITGLAHIGSNFGIFHQNSITLGVFSGGAYTFSFLQNAVKDIGALPGSVISIGVKVFFWSDRDIYEWSGVGDPTPIGAGVKNAVLQNLYVASSKYRITAAHDPNRGLVFWSYASTSGTGTPDKILCYNYRARIFSLIDLTTHCIWVHVTGAVEMDAADTTYPIVDDMPYDMDSSLYQANTYVLSCVDGDDKTMATFVGAALMGVVETGDIATSDGKIAHIRRVRPIVHNAVTAPSVRVGTKMNENESVSYSLPRAVGSNGFSDVRKSGRYVRFELTTGNHSGITSMDVEVVETGLR